MQLNFNQVETRVQLNSKGKPHANKAKKVDSDPEDSIADSSDDSSADSSADASKPHVTKTPSPDKSPKEHLHQVDEDYFIIIH